MLDSNSRRSTLDTNATDVAVEFPLLTTSAPELSYCSFSLASPTYFGTVRRSKTAGNSYCHEYNYHLPPKYDMFPPPLIQCSYGFNTLSAYTIYAATPTQFTKYTFHPFSLTRKKMLFTLLQVYLVNCVGVAAYIKFP